MSDKDADTATAEAPKAEGAAPAGAKGGSGGGAAAWLPLIVTLVAMPALAFAATKFMIIPQIQKAVAAASGAHGDEASGTEHAAGGGEEKGGAAAAGGHGAPAAAAGGHGAAGDAKEKPHYVLNKLIVNVAGTMGTRLLMSSFTLVGAKADFKAKAEEHVDQLKDLAGAVLANKTIAEIEKPGFRNQIRAELITVFNEALGDGVVKEVFLTEFAIQ